MHKVCTALEEKERTYVCCCVPNMVLGDGEGASSCLQRSGVLRHRRRKDKRRWLLRVGALHASAMASSMDISADAGSPGAVPFAPEPSNVAVSAAQNISGLNVAL